MKRKTAMLLALAFVSASLGACAKTAAVTPNPKHVIAVPSDIDPSKSGASSYASSGDHFDSAYYAHPDFYNMTSTATLTILPKFETYQQTTEWSCGPAAILMVLHFLGNDEWNELSISDYTETRNHGASPADLVKFFKHIGWDYQTTASGNGLADARFFGYDDTGAFRDWVISSLKDGVPIMIDWVDWAGHWQVIIGYDTMGTDGVGDDILIVADPYDTSDHYQDGYYILNAERFFYMWRSGDGKDTQPFVIATPPQK